MKKSKSLKALLFAFVIAQTTWSVSAYAGVILTGQNTAYGGYIFYAASGPILMAPCNSLLRSMKSDALIECRRRGYKISEVIGEPKLIAHGGDREENMYCTMELTVECL